MTQQQILVVDDDVVVRGLLVKRLQLGGYVLREAVCGAEALERCAGVDLAILDYQLPDIDGLSVLATLKQHQPDLIVILLTGYADVDRAVSAMRLGAYHFLAKPFDLEALIVMVGQALSRPSSPRVAVSLRADQTPVRPTDQIVGTSATMLRFKKLLLRAAASPASTVVIDGESGTGKGLAARVLHESSTRAPRPFVNITCPTLPETLLESELFGHERGAFTDARTQKRGLLELADGGTVFLDEISELPPALQAKLLRFLEEKTLRRLGGRTDITVDVRVIAATNRALEEEVRQGRFRADLFYRLNVLALTVPPLRERLDDLAPLVSLYLNTFNHLFQKQVRGVSESVLERLARHRWPGNVRELRNVVERAMLLTSADVLEPEDLGLPGPPETATGVRLPQQGIDLAGLEKRLVLEALERTGWNRTRAARMLGLNRDQICYRIQKFKLAVDDAGLRCSTAPLANTRRQPL